MFLNSVHLHNNLAWIYLNTQEVDTKCRKFVPTNLIPTCERSHVLVTYQTLAYQVNESFPHMIDYNFRNEPHVRTYRHIVTHDI